MSRRQINADGTITVMSMSYFGDGDPDEALRAQWEAVERHNQEALVAWAKLTPEEQAARTAQFEAQG
jgi:hypothetical protein